MPTLPQRTREGWGNPIFGNGPKGWASPQPGLRGVQLFAALTSINLLAGGPAFVIDDTVITVGAPLFAFCAKGG